MSAPTKKKKKKKQAKTQKAPFNLPRYVDLAKAFKAIDDSSESEEDKEGMKKVLACLAFFANENGEVRLDDEILTFDSSLLRRE